jgi:electron transfer flavoprotein beta subunit
MHIVVCIKQVPDSAQIRVHPVTNTIMRHGVPAIINPYDLFSLEAALRLKDEHGGRVTVLTMGPPQAATALRKCVSYGADDAILVTDRAFAGADTLATSCALASAIMQIAKRHAVDIVFCGKQTIDGDTAQVGPGVARRLDLQLLTYVARVERLDPAARTIEVHRRAEGGVEVLCTRLPCLITMLEGTNELRFATMDDMFRAARCEIQVWDRVKAGIEDVNRIGLKGSPTVVNKVFAPQPRAQRAEMVEADGDAPRDLALTLVARLFTQHPKLGEAIQRRAA